MPQAPQYLRDEFEDDSEALHLLEANFVVDRSGMFRQRDPHYLATAKEVRALEYLILEWDYGFHAGTPLDPATVTRKISN